MPGLTTTCAYPAVPTTTSPGRTGSQWDPADRVVSSGWNRVTGETPGLITTCAGILVLDQLISRPRARRTYLLVTYAHTVPTYLSLHLLKLHSEVSFSISWCYFKFQVCWIDESISDININILMNVSIFFQFYKLGTELCIINAEFLLEKRGSEYEHWMLVIKIVPSEQFLKRT